MTRGALTEGSVRPGWHAHVFVSMPFREGVKTCSRRREHATRRVLPVSLAILATGIASARADVPPEADAAIRLKIAEVGKLAAAIVIDGKADDWVGIPTIEAPATTGKD